MSDVQILSTEKSSLKLEDETALQKFEMGVASAIFLWDDLDTAVLSGWGGPESAEKREWLVGSVLDLFDLPEVGTDDIEFRLLAAMEDEFDVNVETDSAFFVAQDIITVYKQCSQGDFSLATKLFERYQRKAPGKVINREEVADDSDCEGCGNSHDHTHTHMHEHVIHNQDGNNQDDMQVDEPQADNSQKHKHKHSEPEIDDDGFQIVRKR